MTGHNDRSAPHQVAVPVGVRFRELQFLPLYIPQQSKKALCRLRYVVVAVAFLKECVLVTPELKSNSISHNANLQ